MNRLIFILMLAIGPLTAFASVTLKFVDSQGSSVENVVVSVSGVNSKPALDNSPVMDQIQKQFVPHVLVIQRGQSVSFPNSDNIRHHVYSFSAPKPFEIRLFQGAEADPVTFDHPGIVVLGCNIHDQMLGFIFVANNEATTISSADGIVVLAAGTTKIQVWHPRLSVNHSKRLAFDLSSNEQTVVLDLLPIKAESEKRKFKSRFGQEED